MKVTRHIVLIAAATLAAGGLVAPPTAGAAPCQVWKLQEPVLSMTTSDGSRATFDWDPGTQRVTVGQMNSGGTAWSTTYAVGKAEGTGIGINVAWANPQAPFGGGPSVTGNVYNDIFNGTIQPDGQVTGTRLDSANNSTTWLADQRFTCADQAAAPEPVPDKPLRGVGKPREVNPDPGPVLNVQNAIKLSFGPPKAFSITATITNSSALKAQCTYDADPLDEHRDFTVEPKSSTDLTIEGVRTFTTYHVVVSCHDASGAQADEIGHAETDVLF